MLQVQLQTLHGVVIHTLQGVRLPHPNTKGGTCVHIVGELLGPFRDRPWGYPKLWHPNPNCLHRIL